jgi:hypothetical protein
MDNRPFFQLFQGGKRTSAGGSAVVIFPRPARLFHGTEDDVQGVPKVS